MKRRQAFFTEQPRYPVRARVRARSRDQLAGAALDVTAQTSDTGQWLLLDLVFADQPHAATVLWNLGPDVEVIDPQPLRDTLTARADETLHHFRQR